MLRSLHVRFENGELYYRRAQSANPIDINGEE